MTVPSWVEYFSLELAAHHGTTDYPLKQEAFEAAFRNSCDAAGWPLSEPGPMTQRFVDLSVTPDDGRQRNLSLKSTSAKNLSERTIHISKLTEAAWIQDLRSASDRRDRMVGLIDEYCDAVDSIVMLRHWRRPTEGLEHRYQLVEIDASKFRGINDLPLDDFRADGPSLAIPVGVQPPDLKIRVDRSDAKITIASILVERCIVHGEWRLESHVDA